MRSGSASLRPVSGDRTASLGRSLLGSDAFVEAGRARRVPARKQLKRGPLLNCTSESRRRAQAGDERALTFEEPPAAPSEASSKAWVAVAVLACALLPWRIAALVVCAICAFVVRRKKTVQAPKAVAVRQLPSCWESSERAPPPLAELPAEDFDEPWMKEAGVASRWKLKERRFLARVRTAYARELQGLPPYLDAYGDRRMLRFLRMDPQQDEDRAFVKVGDYLKWRRESRADETRALVPERGGEPRLWPHGDVLMDCIRLIQCSDCYFDKQGHAVTVYQAFHWPAPALRAKVGGMSTAQLVEFATFGAEYNAVQMEKIAVARERVLLDHAKQLFAEGKLTPQRSPLLRDGWGEITRLCAITDMKGCSFGSMMMPQLIPAVVQAVSIFVNYYPYIVGELHVINCAPLVATIFKRALRTVVPKHIADQVKVHVKASELLDSVRADHLPVQVGGRAVCDELIPPPPPPDDLANSSPRADDLGKTGDAMHATASSPNLRDDNDESETPRRKESSTGNLQQHMKNGRGAASAPSSQATRGLAHT